MNPYDLTGPSFLGLLSAAWLVMGTTAAIVRQSMQDSFPWKAPIDPQYSAYEIAYLTGREKNAVQAALASLIQSQTLKVESDGRSFTINSEGRSVDCDSFTGAIKDALAKKTEYSLGTAVQSTQLELKQIFDRIRNKLTLDKLIYDNDTSFQIAIISGALAGMPLWLAVPKLLIGLERGKHVDFLIMEIIVISIVSLFFMLARPFRTKAGEEVLEKYRFKESALKTTAAHNSANLSASEAAMAAALFTVGVFGFGPVYDMRRSLNTSSATSCGGGSGCGGGSCGGGGCGGGCGGCGG